VIQWEICLAEAELAAEPSTGLYATLLNDALKTPSTFILDPAKFLGLPPAEEFVDRELICLGPLN
jgi:hypothetical protein